ncbi:MAG TPA: ferredoxin [Solirubrobacteraceae bacterium]|nr:ferredoxin [Solirubrobacteraceae bacterium]
MKVIHVDLERCQGHGKCYMVAPDDFDFEDEHGRSRFVGAPIDPGDEKRMKLAARAVQACPESALTIVDESR